MYYVIGEGGSKYGPADAATLKQWAAENRLTPTSMLEDATTGVQMQASQVPDIFPPAAPPGGAAPGSPYQSPGSPYSSPGAQPGAQPGGSPYQQNPYSNQGSNYPRGGPATTEGTPTIAIVGWILAGCSLLCCPICLGPAAIYCGWKADQEGYKHGKTLMICAAVAIALGVVIGIVLNVAVGGMQGLQPDSTVQPGLPG